MFSKLFGTTGRQSAPLLETQNRGSTLAQLMGGPGEGANAKAQTSMSGGEGQSEKELLRQKLAEIQAKHNPEPEFDPVEDQEDIALIEYVFTSKPHLMQKVLQSLLEKQLSNPSNNGVS